MKSTRSRSRSKNSRNRNNNNQGGNVVNRVFDSSGPEGKVRGTPSQVIEKYNQLARDATLSNDRVAAENFQQHAEHYLRMLSEAQREQDQRREEQERQNRERQAERDRERAERQERDSNQGGGQHGGNQPRTPDAGEAPQPEVEAPVENTSAEDDSGLVETPESKPKPKRAPRRKPKPKPAAETPPEGGGNDDQPEAAE
ncbi:DUF4167 domain containing protein [Sulfitobacter noctilucicola]|uniref:DUF4167 domain-containing protein n=1 Tax=Sulfitobacter noctilucicola TaxID=1342301 RepID=A0A7W6M7Y7_9RHOB|nr:DUF4167 domain-containing protein [Sulfitobacter noctilucicola]KIN64870.1 DUF4167 domain containing protein [Sulfitobacter noctilucicola]MBB4173986.1 hypothetical protein [Sulfitobacter noctilucicola]